MVAKAVSWSATEVQRLSATGWHSGRVYTAQPRHRLQLEIPSSVHHEPRTVRRNLYRQIHYLILLAGR